MNAGAAGVVRHAPAVRPRRRPAARRQEGERGVATVLAAVLILGMVAITGFGLALGSAMLARHRAEGAADLAALAAAARAPLGPEHACAAASGVAAAMRVGLLDCALDGPDARIVIEIRVPTGLGPLSPQVTGHSRAGPVHR